MAYLRWSFSDWYVYESAQGLEVIPRGSLVEEEKSACYTFDEVVDLLSGATFLASIPGWKMASSVSKQELLWTLREHVAEARDENLYEPFPSMRQIMNGVEKPEEDKDSEGLK